MKNLEIFGPRQVEVFFTANQWQLCADAVSEEAEIVAGILNKELERCINGGYSKHEILRFMHTQMEYFAEVGANGNGPHDVLQSVLETIFPVYRF